MRWARVLAVLVVVSGSALSAPSAGRGLGANYLRCDAGPCCKETRSICNDGGKEDVLDHYLGGLAGCPKNES
jgi:hypothetical protein